MLRHGHQNPPIAWSVPSANGPVLGMIRRDYMPDAHSTKHMPSGAGACHSMNGRAQVAETSCDCVFSRVALTPIERQPRHWSTSYSFKCQLTVVCSPLQWVFYRGALLSRMAGCAGAAAADLPPDRMVHLLLVTSTCEANEPHNCGRSQGQGEVSKHLKPCRFSWDPVHSAACRERCPRCQRFDIDIDSTVVTLQRCPLGSSLLSAHGRQFDINAL